MSTMAYQLLARAQDLCVDVRVTDKRAEGGSGFYFPEQQRQDVGSRKGEPFNVRDVDVQLVNVLLPRLRDLVTADKLVSYAQALGATQAAVDASALPRLVVDLVGGEARVDGVALPLSASELIWYAALALARRDGEGWIRANSLEALRIVADACASLDWTESVQSEPIRALLSMAIKNATKYEDDDEALAADLTKLKADTKRRLKTWCTKHRAASLPVLEPKGRRQHEGGSVTFYQRLALPPDRIEIIGLA